MSDKDLVAAAVAVVHMRQSSTAHGSSVDCLWLPEDQHLDNDCLAAETQDAAAELMVATCLPEEGLHAPDLCANLPTELAARLVTHVLVADGLCQLVTAAAEYQ